MTAPDPGPAGRPDPLAFLADEVAALRERHLYRALRVMSSAQGPIVSIDDRRLISLSSNDYLGLTHHPRVCDAAANAVREFGSGSGAVRTIAGTMSMHEALEAELAVFKETPAVLTFQSGFTANTGVIPVVTGETDLIVSDALNHASIIDGMRLSKAPRKVFPHADVAALREILRDARETGRPEGGEYRLILVVTDGVFSMDGDIAPLPGIVEAAEAFEAAVMVDDAHASGVLGRNGRGSVDHFGLHGRVAIQVGTLSKAVGSLGGYVAGSMALREILTQRARPFLFSTSHPPSVVASCREAIKVMQDEPELLERLWANTRSFKTELTRLGFDTGVSETPITPVMMGDPDTAGRFSDRLIEEGVFAQPVVFPTVAIDKSRLRTIVTAAHADEQLDMALAAFDRVGHELRSHRRVTDRQARDLPLDAHLHTDLSPDSSVPIDTYAAAAVERGIAEIAITDHVDFEPGAPAFGYTTFADRERIVRDAAARWAPQGVRIRFGVELTYDRAWEADIRDHLARHAYDFTIGSVHDRVESPYSPRNVASWIAGRSLADIVAPAFDEVVAAARSGLFDTIGHIDVVKRYLYPHVLPAALEAAPELYEPILRALVDSGTALEVNTSGLRYPVAVTFPHAAIVARFHELGGPAITIGSDAHTAASFAWGLADGYEIAATAGFEALTFRRGPGTARVAVPIPG